MKIKDDFITNSSSASFIFADVRKDKSKPIIGRFVVGGRKINVNLYELLSLRETSDEYSRDDDDETIRHYEDKIGKYTSDEIEILHGWAADDSDDLLVVGLCSIGIDQSNIKTKGVIVLQGEGGY